MQPTRAARPGVRAHFTPRWRDAHPHSLPPKPAHRLRLGLAPSSKVFRLRPESLTQTRNSRQACGCCWR